MIKAAIAINSFAQNGRQDPVSPSEEHIFVLNSPQLEEIIERAVMRATEALRIEVRSLQDRITQLEDYRASNELERAYDRQRLARLEKVEPQPMQKDRAEILRALIAANGGKMLSRDARNKMHLSPSRFSELLATMKDYIEIRPYHKHENWNLLILRAKN